MSLAGRLDRIERAVRGAGEPAVPTHAEMTAARSRALARAYAALGGLLEEAGAPIVLLERVRSCEGALRRECGRDPGGDTPAEAARDEDLIARYDAAHGVALPRDPRAALTERLERLAGHHAALGTVPDPATAPLIELVAHYSGRRAV